MAPGTYFLEISLFGREPSRTALISIMLVLLGVGTAFVPNARSKTFFSLTLMFFRVVSDVSITASGLLAAVVATAASCAQQIGVAHLSRKYVLSSNELVAEVFSAQVISFFFSKSQPGYPSI